MMLVKLVVLVVLMVGTFQAQAQTPAQRNTDVPSGPAIWPPVKSPAPPQAGETPKGSASGSQKGGDSKGDAPAGADTTGAVGIKGNGSNTRGK
jgi:hypothetical protein